MRTKRRAAQSPVKLELEVSMPRRKVASPEVKREDTARRRSTRLPPPEVKPEPERRTSGRHRAVVDYAAEFRITPESSDNEEDVKDESEEEDDKEDVEEAMDEDDVEADLGVESEPGSPVPKRRRATSAQSTPQATPRPTKAARTSRASQTPKTVKTSQNTTPSSSKKRKVAPVTVDSGSEYEDHAAPIVVDSDAASPEPLIVGEPTPEPDADGLVDSRKYENSHLHVQGFEDPLPVVVDNHWVYLFYRFCAERHEMYYRRKAGVPRDQLTTDPTMSAVHIGNVFRQLDPSSIMMRDKIIADGDQSVDEVCFRVFLYCQFYNADSWAALCEAATGDVPSWKTFEKDLPAMESALHDLSIKQKKKIYLGGFQLVPPTVYFDPALNRNRDKNIYNFAASLRLVMAMMESDLPAQLKSCRFAVDASNVLQTIPTLGGFLSLNILCFLNDTPQFTWLYRDFATCGPGSRNYLRRIFGPCISNAEMEDAGLKWLTEQQFKYYARLGQDAPHEWENGLRPGMRVLDVENALCWAHRYVNAYMGEGRRRGKPKLKSFADLPMPRYDPAVTEGCTHAAWAAEKRHVGNSSEAPWATAAEDTLDGAISEQGEDVYEIERVVAKRGRLFRVRWKGWPPEQDTWETEATLRNGAEEALEDWLDWDRRIWTAIERIRVQHAPETTPDGRPVKIAGNVNAQRGAIARQNEREARDRAAEAETREERGEEPPRDVNEEESDSASDDSLDSMD